MLETKEPKAKRTKNRSGSSMVRRVFELEKCAAPPSLAEGYNSITASNVMQKNRQRI